MSFSKFQIPNSRFLVIPALFVSGFVFASSVSASSIFFDSHSLKVDQGNIIEVSVLADTRDEAINALEADLIYPAENLELQSIEDGNSIVSLWLNRPAVTEDGLISFSGIIPGGFTGERGHLFSLIFIAKKAGEIAIDSRNEKMLLNDGQGTAAVVSRSPLILEISTTTDQQRYLPPEDRELPEDFAPMIAQDRHIFNNQWFLVFDTKDKISGLDHYEVAEIRGFKILNFKPDANFFQIAASPYLLKDQDRKSRIYVKAVDKNGNQRIVKIDNAGSRLWRDYLIGCIIILLIVAGCYFIRKKFIFGRHA